MEGRERRGVGQYNVDGIPQAYELCYTDQFQHYNRASYLREQDRLPYDSIKYKSYSLPCDLMMNRWTFSCRLLWQIGNAGRCYKTLGSSEVGGLPHPSAYRQSLQSNLVAVHCRLPHVRSTLPLLTMATEARLACGTYLRVHYHWSVLVEGGDLRLKVKRTIWMQWILAYGQRAVSLFRRTSRRHACVECHAHLSRSFVRKSTVGSILSENRVLLRRRQGLRSCARELIAVLLSSLQCSHTHCISGHARYVS